jgi:hypothetical protein
MTRVSGGLASLAVLSAFLLLAQDAEAFERYSDCSQCHGNFTGSTSPKGSRFPSNDKHQMHRASSAMNTECDLCHTNGDNRDPYIGSSNGTSSNIGRGCVGCHGREEDAGNDGISPGRGAGLRQHHTLSGVTLCTGCHSDASPQNYTPVGEDIKPQYYGTADTNADMSCNPDAVNNANENWTVETPALYLGLDNDGDGYYDAAADTDCGVASPVPLLMRRSTDLRWFTYLLSGNVITSRSFLDLTRSSAYSVVSRADFDADGEPDLLVRDLTPARIQNGRWVLYTITGTTVTSQGFMDTGLTRNADWQLVSSADFDGDSKADLLLRNTVDGRWLLYLLDSHLIKSQSVMPMSADLADTVQGVGDFNGDGSWLVYLLDGLTAPVEGAPAMTANLDFSLQSLGDFNGDGNSDVLMRRADGRWFMYLMNGTAISSSGSPVLTEAPEFQFSNIADFNGDGKSDVLVRRQTDGRWFLYTMNGIAVLDSGAPDMSFNLAFQVISTQDFGSDGNADVLLRRDDGRWVLYEMNGPLVISKGIPDMTRNTAFEIYVP